MISKWELAKINSFAFGLEIVSAAAMTFIVPSLLSSGNNRPYTLKINYNISESFHKIK